ncbi:MAG: hypothetical protein ABMA64_07105 [Myxococcota bacterium]
MAISDFVKSNVHGSFTLYDGSGSPNSLTAAYDLGDVAVSGLSGPYLNDVLDFTRRGRIISSAYGERRFPEISFSAYLTGEGAASPGSLQAFLMRAVPYNANVSVLGSGRVYAVRFVLNIEGTDVGDATDWSTTFNNCVPVDTKFGEGNDGDKFSFTLSVKGSVTGSLTASQIP